MEFKIGYLVWCINIIGFSYIFFKEEKWDGSKYISAAFIILGIVILSFRL